MDRPSWRPSLISFIILLSIFAIALFIRSYFAYGLATQNGFLVSGGSDSYYHKRIIDYARQTGNYLFFDPNLNYPVGTLNPRPPIYQWSVALMGYVISPLFRGDVDTAIWWSFEFGTALWGALTIFPTYLLAKEAFGRRTGYIAALFLAIMPAHIQRSPLSDADWDSLILFFVVLSFFFFLKALRVLRERVYITRWRTALTDPKTFLREARGLLVENRKSFLYAFLSAFSLVTVALTWQGWPYALVIMLGYLFLQLLVDRFRKQDPVGVVAVFSIVGGVPLLLSVPYYTISASMFRSFFIPPLGMYFGGVALGLAFSVTRRYPWIVAIPAIIAASLAAVLIVGTLLFPSVSDALLSGFGYFPRNKIYETIAEAQPPSVSVAILSFGAVTYYLSLAGAAWMLIQFPRKPVPDYIFVVVWAAASIFMAMTQARFLFNASTAFAVSAAWTTSLLIDRLGFEQLGKAIQGFRGRSRFGALRRGTKFRHIVGAIFIATLLVLPNTWLAVDAGSPFEVKNGLDNQVVNSFPAWLRPAGYQQGQLFYFGAFGFSLPLSNTYFPRAWGWLRQQDSDLPAISQRPAYISWWDYGFEAVQQGQHPTVADNFQNGIETAGNFIAAQSEDQAIAILSLRLLDGDWTSINHGRGFSPGVVQALAAHGFSASDFVDVYQHSSSYIPVILADPTRFGPYDSRMSAGNAKIIYLSTVMKEKLDADGQADLYGQLSATTGWSIRYFSIDARLIPFSAQNTGIFYAPIKLSDHRIVERSDGRVIPTDFFKLMAQLAGGQSVDLQQTTPLTQIQSITIQYESMFYKSMLYRAYFGITPAEQGSSVNALPGMPGNGQQLQVLPGWMLSHFRLVYRTAYYNPYPQTQVANHTDAWTAINFPDAEALQAKIAQGQANGTVDLSAASGLSNGIVFVKYYAGAVAQGRISTADGQPLQGVRVTVQDEFGIPHDIGTTDAEGRYQVLLPFGPTKLQVSTGPMDNKTGVGSSVLAQASLNVTDDQAMRRTSDYIFTEDFTIHGQTISGRAFLDGNHNGLLDSGEALFANTPITLRGSLNVTINTTTNSLGAYSVKGLLPGGYATTLHLPGRELSGPNAIVQPGGSGITNLNVTGSTFTASVTYADGTPAAGAILTLVDQANGTSMSATTGATGTAVYRNLIQGEFRVSVRDPTGNYRSLDQTMFLPEGGFTMSFALTRTTTVTGQVTVGGAVGANAPLVFQRRGASDTTTVTSSTDGQGRFSIVLSQGTWDIYALAYRDGRPFAWIGSAALADGGIMNINPNLIPSVTVTGIVYGADRNSTLANVGVVFEGSGPSGPGQGPPRVVAQTGRDGRYTIILPPDQYRVIARSNDRLTNFIHQVGGSETLDLQLPKGTVFTGNVYRDLNNNGRYDPPQEGVADVEIRIEDDLGNAYSAFSQTSGFFDGVGFTDTDYAITARPYGYGPVEVPSMALEAFVDRTSLQVTPNPVALSGTVTLGGTLTPGLGGARITFQGSGRGAGDGTATIQADSSFAATLPPGDYHVVVDYNLTMDGGIKAMNRTASSLTLRLAQGTASLDIDLVKRYRVNATATLAGQPFTDPRGPTVTFSGPEQAQREGHNGSFTVYLTDGSYSVASNLNKDGTDYAYLDLLEVHNPTAFSFDLAPSARVSGRLLTTGNSSIAQSLPLNFTRMAGEIPRGALRVDSDATGRYLAILLPGTYTVSVVNGAFHSVDSLDGVTRYVVYRGPFSVTVASGQATQATDLHLMRDLDNSTLQGLLLAAASPTAGELAFRPTGGGALSAKATATGAGYIVPLQPGTYDVYGHGAYGGRDYAFLGSLTMDPRTTVNFDVPMIQGQGIRGTVTSGQRLGATADLTVTADNSLEAHTAPDGTFSVVVPPGTFTLRASAQVVERGTPIIYSSQANVTVSNADVIQDLVLERQTKRAVAILWDSSQETTIAPGSSVTYTVTVQNRGSIEDVFKLSGSPADWTFTFDRPQIALDFAAGANASSVQVTIITPARAQVEHPPVRIVATSTTDSKAAGSAVVQVGIEQHRDVAIAPSTTPPVLDVTSFDVPIRLQNPGNGADNFTVVLLNTEELASLGWNATLINPADNASLATLPAVYVSAASSRDVVLRLRFQGLGRSGIAMVAAYPEGRQDLEQMTQIPFAFPQLSTGTGGIVVQGVGIGTSQPFPWTYVILAAIVGAAVVLTLLVRRRTSAKRRRRRR